MNDKTDAGITGCVLAILGVPVMMLVMSVLNGWVTTYIWAWFVVPIFHVPPLTLLPAIGLRIAVNQIISKGATPKETQPFATTLFVEFTFPFISLAFAWFIHWLMLVHG